MHAQRLTDYTGLLTWLTYTISSANKANNGVLLITVNPPVVQQLLRKGGRQTLVLLTNNTTAHENTLHDARKSHNVQLLLQKLLLNPKSTGFYSFWQKDTAWLRCWRFVYLTHYSEAGDRLRAGKCVTVRTNGLAVTAFAQCLSQTGCQGTSFNGAQILEPKSNFRKKNCWNATWDYSAHFDWKVYEQKKTDERLEHPRWQ